MTSRRKFGPAVAGVAIAAGSIFLLGACSSNDSLSDSTTTSTAPTTAPATGKTTPTVNAADKPKVTIPDTPPPTTLQTKDIKVGTGAEAKAGSAVTVNYVGVSYSTKKEFDASYDAGRPFTFTLGQGEVIKGWDEGVAGMKVGGQRELTIPPDKGYGARGAGSDIGPNETLVFIVDLVAVN